MNTWHQSQFDLLALFQCEQICKDSSIKKLSIFDNKDYILYRQDLRRIKHFFNYSFFQYFVNIHSSVSRRSILRYHIEIFNSIFIIYFISIDQCHSLSNLFLNARTEYEVKPNAGYTEDISYFDIPRLSTDGIIHSSR